MKKEKNHKYRISGLDDLMRWSNHHQAYIFITKLNGRTLKQAIKEYEEMDLASALSEES